MIIVKTTKKLSDKLNRIGIKALGKLEIFLEQNTIVMLLPLLQLRFETNFYKDLVFLLAVLVSGWIIVNPTESFTTVGHHTQTDHVVLPSVYSRRFWDGRPSSEGRLQSAGSAQAFMSG
ncbi:hypothetical protein OCU04_004054 [Sclerotinia nivalis]|uniref:Uncharacterized protein n=1 Tax=Sclerotinia nivalis TaxID=352851 RepID=A0A9X0AT94_9HELO|nr:hypothetical protein OCU04_004054 [Sclerotinia nivalis]